MATNLLLPPLKASHTKKGDNLRGTTNGAPARKISPTYISSDLHSPEQKQRITIPFLGVQTREAPVHGGKTWGENPTEYGGIGKMSFLDKKRTKELFVSRGQKHYSSALSRYENQMQPYMLTAFKYSGCRQNDQVLPPSFKVGLDPYGLTVFDGYPIMPYFSHNCKHEVLPRNDPNRLDENGHPVLTERTRNSLQEMYTDLYEEPFYNKIFPNRFKKNCEEDGLQFQSPKQIHQEKRISHSDNAHYSKYNINPTLAKLCFLSSRNQQNGKMAPLRVLLMNWLEHPSVFSEFRFEELYRLIKDLQLFNTSDSAKHLGVHLEDYPLDRMVKILESTANNTEKLLLLREALGLLPPPACLVNGEEIDKDEKASSNDISDNHTLKVVHSKEGEDNKGIYHCGEHPKLLTATLPRRTADYNDSVQKKQESMPVKSVEKNPAELSSRETIHGTSPCWPPSKSYGMDLRTMQLKCPPHLPCGQSPGNHDHTTGENTGGSNKEYYSAINFDIGCNKKVPTYHVNQDYKSDDNLLRKIQDDYTFRNHCENNNSNYNVPTFQRVGSAKRKQEDSDETMGLTEYKQYLNSFLPFPFDLRGQVHDTIPCNIITTPPSTNRLNKAQFVGYDKLGRKTFLPPVPLRDCLQHCGERIQDRVGLHFKTEAHKRFHAMYPDSVPDLRDNMSYRKRYFFSGYHTSVFRG